MPAATDRRSHIFPKSGPGSHALLRKWLSSLAHFFRGAPKFSLFCLTFTIICAIAAPLLPFDPVKGDLTNPLQPPAWGAHPLGTDHQGRDMIVRLIHGANISVTVGFLAVFVSGAAGTLIAVFAGVFKGWVDGLLIQLTDAFMALPFLMVAVAVVSLLGPSKTNVILVLGLLRWMSYARILRSEVLSITETDYVRLAKVAGASNWRIILRHVLPNLANTLLIISTLELGTVIIFESALSFLGLGVPRPLPSWGTMLADSQSYIYNQWWLPVMPGVAISFLVMSTNLTGDWLRERVDHTRLQV